MMAKYNLKAETGKFESKLQPGQPEPKRIAAGDVVIGVVQMHGAMVHMIKALQASNGFLLQVQAAMDLQTGELVITLMPGALDEMIQANNAALGQIELD